MHRGLKSVKARAHERAKKIRSAHARAKLHHVDLTLQKLNRRRGTRALTTSRTDRRSTHLEMQPGRLTSHHHSRYSAKSCLWSCRGHHRLSVLEGRSIAR